MIYASVPSAAGVNGNSVLPIEPATGIIGLPIPVGSEPTQLALSDDGQYLYVGLAGTGAVQRINLVEQRPDRHIPLGHHPGAGQYYPIDLAVAPGRPDTIAVARRTGSRDSWTAATVALYANGEGVS